MMTYDIYRYINNDSVSKHCFLGVYSSDETIPHENGFCIFNSEPSYKNGRHWLAYFKNDNYVEFFDSCGHNPLHYDLPICCKYNNVRVQGNHPVCGYYCLMYVMLRCRGIELETIVSLMKMYNDVQIVRDFFTSETLDIDKVIRTIAGLLYSSAH